MKLLKNIFLLMCFSSLICCSAAKLVTMEKFSDVPIGISVVELKKQLGQPDEIRKIDESEMVYVYIERIKIGGRTIEQNHYLFIINEGKVTSKEVKYETIPPLYQRNAYELQTSYNETEE